MNPIIGRWAHTKDKVAVGIVVAVNDNFELLIWDRYGDGSLTFWPYVTVVVV